MPGKFKRSEYDLVEEAHDGKIPVHNEDAFEHGLRFKVKYIGTKEIYKPSSRAEIVTAMRKIRYEYKIHGIKKDKTEMLVSLTGIKVIHKQHKGGGIVKRKKEFVETVMLSHVINRVFYVSHDSQDLHIFSYIVKEGDIFKCSVFKAMSKDQAMHIVRTIGQAFDVCHKRSTQDSQKAASTEDQVPRQKGDGDCGVPDSGGATDKLQDAEVAIEAVATDKAIGAIKQESADSKDKPQTTVNNSMDFGMARVLTLKDLKHIYEQQLEHQKQETVAAVTEVTMLTAKLEAETSARIAAQKQVEVVLKHNRELIVTMQQFVNQMQVEDYSETPLKPDSINRHTTPSAGAGKGSNASSRTKHLTPPVFPHIPPPSKTPSPDSHHSTPKNTSSDSFAHRSTSGTTNTSGMTPVFDSRSSELDMIEPRQVPVPQEFLQFVFDSSSRSDYFEANSETSQTSLAVVNNGQIEVSGNSSAETLTEEFPRKNGQA